MLPTAAPTVQPTAAPTIATSAANVANKISSSQGARSVQHTVPQYSVLQDRLHQRKYPLGLDWPTPPISQAWS